MAENLKTTHDADEVPIDRWCYDCDMYGGMYDWSAAMNGSDIDGAQSIYPTRVPISSTPHSLEATEIS